VRSAWYQAARTHGRGRVTVAGTTRDVVLHTDGQDFPAGRIDEAFTAKYGPAAALVAADAARAATIRISPAPPRT
jgi:hypothetical protein